MTHPLIGRRTLCRRAALLAGFFLASTGCAKAQYVPGGACPAHQWVSAYGFGTGLSCAQPGFADLASPGATLNTQPSNPTGTTSTAPQMAGLGSTCTLTPTYSTRAYVWIGGVPSNTVAGGGVYVQLRYGSGTVPANGAAAAGTHVNGNIAVTSVPSAGAQVPFSAAAVITGLTPGTAFWFDLGQAVNGGGGGTASAQNLACGAFEM